MSICRICFLPNSDVEAMFTKVDIVNKIYFCTGVQFKKEDHLPKYICIKCKGDLAVAHKFKKQCQSADQLFRKLMLAKDLRVMSARQGRMIHLTEDKRTKQPKRVENFEVFADQINIKLESNNSTAKKRGRPKKCDKPNVDLPSSKKARNRPGKDEKRDNTIEENKESIQKKKEISNLNIVKVEFDDKDYRKPEINFKTENSFEIEIEKVEADETQLEDTALTETHLTNTPLEVTHLEESNLNETHLESDDWWEEVQPIEIEADVNIINETSNKTPEKSKSGLESNIMYRLLKKDISTGGHVDQEITTKYVRKMKYVRNVKNVKIQCEPCGIVFRTTEESAAHRKEYHNTVVCEICGKVMPRGSYASHMRSHQLPQYACDTCGYRTVNKGDLTKHIVRHSGLRKYQCEYCTKAYFTSSSLCYHIRCSHRREQRYTCPVCGMGFYDRTKLRRHTDSHNNIKRYECEYCHSAYSRRCHWKKHLQQQHNIVLPRMRPGRAPLHLLIGDLVDKATVKEIGKEQIEILIDRDSSVFESGH